MKTFLSIAAALGLTISAASAECPGHSKVQASVDTQTKTASVEKADTSTSADIKEEVPPKAE
ncbi:hypothetical protein D3227_05960 [Mesorhizobium waimense]|uniref:DUF680 domain-containing protein n=1 Tax=Mesorhizobium waimense TaxID=1300307 RepID=A0A3A5LAM7_9HYPH|nr:hypothetical protein [Mesorhizobium waimense]RJT41339.1 hypothetical protein D3227_05960 [Mesorhizobium waimense]